jgi:uncharacterized protein (DUF362 family)
MMSDRLPPADALTRVLDASQPPTAKPCRRRAASPLRGALLLLCATVLAATTAYARPGDTPEGRAGADRTPSSVAPGPAVVGVIRSDNPSLPDPVAPDQPLSVQQVEDMVRAAVQACGGLEQALRPDARSVAIKTNIVEVKEPGDGTITDWRVVRAIALIAHEIAPDAVIKVIEACNWDAPGGERWKEDGWGYGGYSELVSEPYIRLVNSNLDSTYSRDVPGGGLVRGSYRVSTTTDTVDCFIDAPVVKIIGVVGLTAAMKNLVGMIPIDDHTGRQQALNHAYGYLDEGIVELNLLHPVDFVVADVIVGLERAKTTSWDGQAVRLNTVLASTDVVAADAVSARLIGLNPDDIEYLTIAARLGLGVADARRIQVRGEDVQRVSRRFEKMRNLPDRYGQTPKIWTLSGPYATKDPDELFLDPGELDVVPGLDGWGELVYFRTDEINLKKALGRPRNCTAYAYTEFDAPRDEPAELWVGSGEAMTVWIDGREVYRYRGNRRHKVPSDRHPIDLRAGHHALLVQVYQTMGSFDFSLNICEAVGDERYSGNRVTGLEFSPPGEHLPPVPRQTGAEQAIAFDLADWLTERTFAIDIVDVIDAADGLVTESIRCIDLDARQRLWVAANDGLLCRTGDTTWTSYGEEDGVRPGRVRDFLVNPSDESVWISVQGKLHRYDGETWKVYFPDNWHGSIFLDDQGRTCASVFHNGVRCYQDGQWESIRTYDEELEDANRAESARIDGDGTCWIGTWGHGVWRYDGRTWRQYVARDGLADNHVPTLRVAPNGDIWAGFDGPGISRMRRGKWRSYYDDGAPDKQIDALLITRDGTLWAASDGAVLSRYDGKHWASATCTDEIEDMVEDAQGRLLLATQTSVVVVVEVK